MIIKKRGTYILTEDISSRGSRSITQFKKGTPFLITQIDAQGHKVIGPSFEDWMYWDIPCVKETQNDS